MRKLLLSTLISTALLTACGDNGDSTTTTSTQSDTTDKVVSKAVNVDPATRAENAFNDMTTALQRYYQTVVLQSPLVKSFQYTTDSYEKGENSAMATTKVVVELSDSSVKPLNFSLRHNIKYNADTLASGAIAQIDSTLVQDAELSPEAAKYLNQLVMKTTIQKDETFSQQLDLPATTVAGTVNDESNNLNFSGLSLTINSSIKNVADGGFGDFALNFKGASDDDFSIEPFKASGNYQPDGNFTFIGSALTMGDAEAKISIQSLSGNGKMLHNDKYNLMLGSGTYQFDNISIVSTDSPAPITLDKITMDFDTSMNDQELVDSTIDMHIIPSADLVSGFSQGMFDANTIDTHFAMRNLPAEVMTDYQNFMQNLYETAANSSSNSDEMPDLSPESKAQLKAMFDKVKAQAGAVDFAIDLKGTQGTIHLDAAAQMKSDSPFAFEQLETLSQDPTQALQLLDVNANASAPAALLEGLGIQMMAGPFLQKNGDVYQSQVKSENGQLLINGIPAPL